MQMRVTVTCWDEEDKPLYVKGQTFTVLARPDADTVHAADHNGEHLFDFGYCEFGQWETGPNPNFQIWKPLHAPEVTR